MKLIIGLVFLLLASLSMPGLTSARASERPVIKEIGYLSLDTTVADMGVIPPDTVTTRVLTFRNTGNAPFQILSIFSDCGCTSSEYTTDPIEPGKEGEIHIKFNSKGRHSGEFFKVLRIRSNAQNPRVNLTVKGTID